MSSTRSTTGVLGARVGRTVNVAHALTTDSGIDLGGSEIGVTQHFLHGTQIGTSVQKMSGKGVAQRMRMRRGHRSTIENASHIARCQLAACPIEEQRGRGRIGGDQARSTVTDPAGDCLGGRLGDGHDPLLGPLAPNPEHPAVVDVVKFETA